MEERGGREEREGRGWEGGTSQEEEEKGELGWSVFNMVVMSARTSHWTSSTRWNATTKHRTGKQALIVD